MKRISLIVLMTVFLGSCKSDVTSLPKEFHGGIVRGKTDDLEQIALTLKRSYYLSIMRKDSILVCIQVPKILYVTYQKGDTIK